MFLSGMLFDFYQVHPHSAVYLLMELVPPSACSPWFFPQSLQAQRILLFLCVKPWNPVHLPGHCPQGQGGVSLLSYRQWDHHYYLTSTLNSTQNSRLKLSRKQKSLSLPQICFHQGVQFRRIQIFFQQICADFAHCATVSGLCRYYGDITGGNSY